MRLSSVASALLSVVILLVQDNASANVKASDAALRSDSSSNDRPGNSTHDVSELPSAEDDEREGGGLKAFYWGDIAAHFLSKDMLAMKKGGLVSRTKAKLTWWWMRSVHPNKVFDKLKLDEAGSQILSTLEFRVWARLVESYNLRHPDKQVSILLKLQETYEEYALSVMLEEAKQGTVEAGRQICTKLQIEQMERWKDNKLNALKLYMNLQHGKEMPTLLTGPALNVWNTYVTKFQPYHKETVFENLHLTFDDAELSSLLIAAKQSVETQALATGLQKQLIKVWLAGKVPPKLVFEHLLLNKDTNRLLDREETKQWVRYALVYGAKTKTKVTLDEMIKSHYNAKEIAKIIESSTTDYGEHLATKFAPVQA